MAIDKKQAKIALGVFERTGKNELFINSKGEFFTSENYAKLSDKKAFKITKGEMQSIASSTDKAAEKAAKAASEAEEKKQGEAIMAKLDGKNGDEAAAILSELKRSELDSLDSFFGADVKGQPNMDAARQVILEELNETDNG